MDKVLLEHLKTYLQLHHDKNDGGVHINLIARINEALEKPSTPSLSDFSLEEINREWNKRASELFDKIKKKP